MIKIEEIPLNITLPDYGIRMIFMQPFVELCNSEPFCWRNDKKNKQINRIVRTLEIARQVEHDCEKTHFTIFPEYAIPGLEGVNKIQEILKDSSWKDGTIVIGGVDGLTQNDYFTLCNEYETQVHNENKAERIFKDKWINCCIVWVKYEDGTVKRWIQPKLCPSWPETDVTHSQMFAGRAIYLFSGKFKNNTDFRFFSLICFDWIGLLGTKYGIDAILSEINKKWSNNSKKEINLVFVLQYNSKPNHYNFLENTRNYFVKKTDYPFIGRDDSVILFANTAGDAKPGRYVEYGYSSLIFSPRTRNTPYNDNACPCTFALITQKLRGTDSLGKCIDVLFREIGACVHSFKFRLPQFINIDRADRCLPIEVATVYAIEEGIDDPRVPGKPVPASVKWINDQLDTILHLLANKQNHPLKNSLASAYKYISDLIRKQSGGFLDSYIEMSLCEIKNNENKWIKTGGGEIYNVDNWNETERDVLIVILDSLSIIKTCKPLEVAHPYAHATLKIQNIVIDVMIVSGKSHEECLKHVKHAKKRYGIEQRFIMVITHDGKSSLPPKCKDSILDVEYDLSKGPNIADPDSRFIHCGYMNLINICFHSTSLEELSGKISQMMGV